MSSSSQLAESSEKFSLEMSSHLMEILVSLQKNLGPAKFSLSADKKYLLLAQNVQKLFRHSFLAQYTVYDIQAR